MWPAFLFSAPDPDLSCAAIVVETGHVAAAGTVLGQRRLGAATVSAGPNQGDGTLALSPAGRARRRAETGAYRVECIIPWPGGGTFRVYAPHWRNRGDVLVGDTYDDHVTFVITPGAIDFAKGDHFTIDVAKGSGRFVPLDPTAEDGAQIASCILLADVDTSSGPVTCQAIACNAVINPSALIWPAGYTTEQRAAGLAELHTQKILT